MAYWLPVYFHAVKEATPTQSGVDTLPVSMIVVPFSILAGQGVTHLGRFRPFQVVGITLLTLSVGIFSLLDINSFAGFWVGFQVIALAGGGLLLTCTLPAVQAPLPKADVAVATATWGFLRSFGGVWGVVIPTAIFKSHVNSLLDQGLVSDALSNGGAYALAATGFVQPLEPVLKQEVKMIYVYSLRLVCQVAVAFGLARFVVSLVVKEVKMREDHDTDFGPVGGPGQNTISPSDKPDDVSSVEKGHQKVERNATPTPTTLSER